MAIIDLRQKHASYLPYYISSRITKKKKIHYLYNCASFKDNLDQS